MKTRPISPRAQSQNGRRGMASVFVITILALVALLLMGSGRMVRQMKQEVDLAERLQLRRLKPSWSPTASPREAPAEAEPEVSAGEPESAGAATTPPVSAHL